MTPLGRAVLGAAIGGTLALAIHPASRPYFLGVLESRSPESLRAWVPDLARELPPPKSLREAALWLRVGTAKNREGIGLTKSERRTLSELARRGEEKDRTNAFWTQMRAVLAAGDGKKREAAEYWRRAGIATTWNDLQNDALQTALSRFAFNRNQAWPYAFLMTCRSHAAEVAAEKYARTTLADADLSSVSGQGGESKSFGTAF